jgi:hypothetical protein
VRRSGPPIDCPTDSASKASDPAPAKASAPRREIVGAAGAGLTRRLASSGSGRVRTVLTRNSRSSPRSRSALITAGNLMVAWTANAAVEGGAGGELMQLERVVQHARAVKRENRAERVWRREYRQARRGMAAQCPGPKQRVKVSAVIGMSVADDHRVYRSRGTAFQQARERRVPGIDRHPVAVVLDQVATARRPGGRPPAAPAQDRQPHTGNLADRRRAGLCAEP